MAISGSKYKKINFDKKTAVDRETGEVSTFKKVKSGGGSSTIITPTGQSEVQKDANGNETVKLYNIPTPVVEEARFYTDPKTGITKQETREQTNTRRLIQSGTTASNLSGNKVPLQNKTSSFSNQITPGANQTFSSSQFQKGVEFQRNRIQAQQQKSGELQTGTQDRLAGLSYTEKAKIYEQEMRESGNLKQKGKYISLWAGYSVAGVGQDLYKTVTSPIQSIKNTYSAVTNPKETALNIKTDLETSPATNILQTFTGYKATDLAISGAQKAKVAIKTANAPEIPASTIFEKSTLTKGVSFPEAKSTQATIKQLEVAQNKVVTLSPVKLGKVSTDTLAPTSNLNIFEPKKRMAGETRKGSLGLEDGGINVAPLGQGNPYFARVNKGETEFTLNPIKAVKSSIDRLNAEPTATIFKTQGVQNIPTSVLSKKGFSAVKEYQKQVAGSGKVLPTKRGMIGQGEIKAQFYKSPSSYITPEGKVIKKGDIVKEKGSIEIELTIPQTQEFTKPKIIGKTKVKGETFVIRESDLIVSKKVRPAKNSVLDDIATKGDDILTRGAGSSYKTGVSYKTPYGSLLRSVGTSKSSKSSSDLSKYSSGGSSKGLSGVNLSSFRVGGGSSRPTIPGGSSSGEGLPIGGSSLTTPGGGSSTGGGTSAGSSIFNTPYGGGASSKTTPPTRPRFKAVKGEKVAQDGGVNVFVRERGKVIKVNKKPLPISQAVKLGQNVVDNTTLASFEIRGKNLNKNKMGVSESNKFVGKQTKIGLFFKEKTQNRIDTQGERKGLSFAKFTKQRGFRL